MACLVSVYVIKCNDIVLFLLFAIATLIVETRDGNATVRFRGAIENR